MSIRVLIVDDEGDFIERVSFGLKGFDIIAAASVVEAKKRINESIDVIMLDLNLNPADDKMEGLDLINYFKSEFPHIPITIITGYDDVDIAVRAMKRGADDFLKKRDMDILEWRKRIELLARTKSLKVQVTDYEREKYQFTGESNTVKDIKKNLKTLGQYPDITLLIRGETGVGKEVAAKYHHSHSIRSERPFVPVNISSIQSTLLESALFGHKKGAFTGAESDRLGYFRKADGGVLFLDEIGDLNLESQGKILRFLEDKIINVVGDEKDIKLDLQVVAATNKGLEDLVRMGSFREDLYYRIKNFTVDIPPLRKRKTDIPLLLQHFLKIRGHYSEADMVSQEAWGIFMAYNWPGNIRELRNTIDSALIKSQNKKIELQHLPKELIDTSPQTSINQGENLEFPFDLEEKANRFQLKLIDRALGITFGNKGKAAEMLNLDLDKMRYKVINNHSLILNGAYSNIKKYYKKLF
jgi:DNA-binding NtrC family response regulator